MRVLSREVFIEPEDGRGVFPGFVTYVSADEPVLMYLYGRVDHSDASDDYVETVSGDNGRTWSEPLLRFKSREAPGGRVRYCEPTAYFDADASALVLMNERGFYPDDERVQGIVWELLISTRDFARDAWGEPVAARLGFPEGVGLSFCFPIKTSRGRVLFPAQKPLVDEAGRFVHHRGYWSRAYEALAIIGEYAADGTLGWRAGGRVAGDLERTCRGLCEPTLVELGDGRIAMICRGDNGAFPDRPGYKWAAFSGDDGQTWSSPRPLGCIDGEPIESPSSGSAAFRSIADGKLYWIGNLCVDGERPSGNGPRSPLVIAELSEEPFALRRETITVLDRKRAEDTPATQLSNFRYYQDRETGEVVLFLTRFGEADAEDWRRANHYRYRIAF